MPTAITLKNIPDEIYDRLKLAAKANHRSVNKQAIVCLEQALQPAQKSSEEILTRIRALRASLGTRKFNHREIERAINWGRE